MNYAVKHDPDDSDDDEHAWYVEYEDDGVLVSLNGLREYQAHVIAWALERVTEDGTLESRRVVGRAGDWGVAPPHAAVYEMETYAGPLPACDPNVTPPPPTGR